MVCLFTYKQQNSDFTNTMYPDLHEYLGGPNLCPTTPHPITNEKVPITLGHEFSGIVEDVGEGVSKYKKGDRVVIQPIIYDNTCGACRAGQINCCYKNGFVGLSGMFSAHATREDKSS